MTLLAFLPCEIVSAILDKGISPSVIKLWISGDRMMQHKLASGVTKIKLVDPNGLSTSRFPMFILQLRSLRELTIDRRGFSMLYYYRLPQYVQRLPSTLKKLILRVKSSRQIINTSGPFDDCGAISNAQSHVANGVSRPRWTFAGAFPQLETLELNFDDDRWEAHHFALLPQSITSLAVPPCTSDVYEQFPSLLPPHLLTLKVVGRSEDLSSSFWSYLPPQLTKLDVRPFYDADDEPRASQLPRSLRVLHDSFSENLDLADLPSGLEYLDTNWILPSDSLTLIGRVLPNLKRISIPDITKEILRSLPPTIQSIETDNIDPLIESKDWPPSLTKIRCPTFHDFPLSNLPVGLVELITKYSKMSDISVLPRTLLHLQLQSRELIPSENVDFPPHLVHLEMTGYRDPIPGFPYHQLPSSITSLHLDYVPASQIKNLPPRLKSLSVQDFVLDPYYEPYSEAEIAAMRSKFEFGRREGVLDASFDFARLNHVSIPALLPRTLTLLEIHNPHGEAIQEDWSLIPPKLESFHYNPEKGLASDLLHHLPFKSLTTLCVTFFGAEDHHLKLIPRHTVQVALIFVNSPNLTPMALEYVSRSGYYDSNNLRQPLNKLRQLQEKHADYANPSKFLKLMSPDKALLRELFPPE